MKTKHRCIYCKKTDAEKFETYRSPEGKVRYFHLWCELEKTLAAGRENF